MKNHLKISLFVALTLLLALSTACAPKQTQAEAHPYTPGTYTASAAGNNGDVTVSVTFSEEAITAVEVTDHSETAAISDPAIERIPARILEGQTLLVDTVAGATNTSKAILEAVESCVKQAGGDPATLKTPSQGAAATPSPETVELSTDVLVIGGGGTGLAASLEASYTGAQVILLERMDFLGGDTARAGGGIEAAGTRFQEANGIHDKPEDFYDFIMSRGVTNRNPELLRVMTEQSEDAVEFLAGLGADMSVQMAGHGSPVARAHRSQSGAAGTNVVNPMLAELERLKIPVYTGTPATELIVENGAVTGAKATNLSSGQKYIIHAKAVVIATGNFAANIEMCAQYDPRLAGVETNSSPGSLGDGIVMATAVGADVENMNIFRVRPNLPTNVSNYIAISQDGERFMDEYHSEDTIFVAGDDLHIRVNEGRKEKHYWVLMDESTRVAQAEKLEKYMVEGRYFTANTLEELAALINVGPDKLTATVLSWNEAVKKGTDAQFGRSAGMDAPIGDGPYFAAKVYPTVHNTGGGIRINVAAAVLDKQEQSIPGLFAGGEVTGGVHDGVSAVCNTIVFGRIAGQSAGQYVKG